MDLTTEQQTIKDEERIKEREEYEKHRLKGGSSGSYTNLDNANEALMENPSLWDNLNDI